MNWIILVININTDKLMLIKICISGGPSVKLWFTRINQEMKKCHFFLNTILRFNFFSSFMADLPTQCARMVVILQWQGVPGLAWGKWKPSWVPLPSAPVLDTCFLCGPCRSFPLGDGFNCVSQYSPTLNYKNGENILKTIYYSWY